MRDKEQVKIAMELLEKYILNYIPEEKREDAKKHFECTNAFIGITDN